MIRQLWTKTRGTLATCSIQSTPVTAVSLLFGYASVTGTVITREAAILVFIGGIGHMGVYGLNDVWDLPWDALDERTTKPLVAGDISVTWGATISSMLIVLAIGLAWGHFPLPAFITWVIAAALGIVYNYYSKEETYAGRYLAAWGFVIIYTGAAYTGEQITGTTVILMLLVGVHMFWMTIMGNLKDIGKGENSIPERLDCRIEDDNGYQYLWTSARFNGVVMVILSIEVILLLILPIGDGIQAHDVEAIYAGIVGSIFILYTTDGVLYQRGFDRDKMKKDIARHEIVSILSVTVVSLSFVSQFSMAVLVLGSVVWGVTWQTVLYGHPLRFP